MTHEGRDERKLFIFCTISGIATKCLGHREEAHELVKSGLTNDMR
jgi:hypothetical protein